MKLGLKLKKILDNACERDYLTNIMLPSRRNLVMGIDFKK